MPFVPGFSHDVFISYAHGDDRAWINSFVDRLKAALARLLPGATVWIDKDDLRKSRDFNLEIPAELESSATIISFVSPIYVQRPYCVQNECRRFLALVGARKQNRFATQEFGNELFGFRCPLFKMDDTAYWNDLIPGSTDILFGDETDSFPVSSSAFEEKFRTLLRGLVDLLRRMRNHSRSWFTRTHHPAKFLKRTVQCGTRIVAV